MLRKVLIAVVLATLGVAGGSLALRPVEAATVSPGAGLMSGLPASGETLMFVRRGGGGYRGYRGGGRGVYRHRGYRGYGRGYRGYGYRGYRGYGYRGYGYRYGYRRYGYPYGYGYGYRYGYGCRWVTRRIWTAYGYRWVNRRICY